MTISRFNIEVRDYSKKLQFSSEKKPVRISIYWVCVALYKMEMAIVFQEHQIKDNNLLQYKGSPDTQLWGFNILLEGIVQKNVFPPQEIINAVFLWPAILDDTFGLLHKKSNSEATLEEEKASLTDTLQSQYDLRACLYMN